MVKISPGTIISLAIIGVIGYVIYKFSTGEWKLPAFPNIFGGLETAAKGVAEGAEVGGVPGAIGGGIYNFFTGKEETLGERIIERTTIVEYRQYEFPPDERLPEEVIGWKAGIEVAAEDTMEGFAFGGGFLGAMVSAPITIGAGLATIQKHSELLESLKDRGEMEAFRRLKWEEWEKRSKFIEEHPLESVIGFGGVLAHHLTRPTHKEMPTEQLKIVLDEAAQGGLLRSFERGLIEKEIQSRQGPPPEAEPLPPLQDPFIPLVTKKELAEEAVEIAVSEPLKKFIPKAFGGLL